MSAFAAVQIAVEDEDHEAFVNSYKSALEAATPVTSPQACLT
jgi:hypothetical protein